MLNFSKRSSWGSGFTFITTAFALFFWLSSAASAAETADWSGVELHITSRAPSTLHNPPRVDGSGSWYWTYALTVNTSSTVDDYASPIRLAYDSPGVYSGRLWQRRAAPTSTEWRMVSVKLTRYAGTGPVYKLEFGEAVSGTVYLWKDRINGASDITTTTTPNTLTPGLRTPEVIAFMGAVANIQVEGWPATQGTGTTQPATQPQSATQPAQTATTQAFAAAITDVVMNETPPGMGLFRDYWLEIKNTAEKPLSKEGYVNTFQWLFAGHDVAVPTTQQAGGGLVTEDLLNDMRRALLEGLWDFRVYWTTLPNESLSFHAMAGIVFVALCLWKSFWIVYDGLFGGNGGQ